jgi:hypothetical protein
VATVTILVVSGSYALSVDDSDDIVRAGQVPGTDPLTIEAWVRPDDASANGLMIVWTDDVNGWSFEFNSGRPMLWLSTNQGWDGAAVCEWGRLDGDERRHADPGAIVEYRWLWQLPLL